MVQDDRIVCQILGFHSECDMCVRLLWKRHVSSRDVPGMTRAAVCVHCRLTVGEKDATLSSLHDLGEHLKAHASAGHRIPAGIGKALEIAGRFFA
jgi:hypothetical protein